MMIPCAEMNSHLSTMASILSKYYTGSEPLIPGKPVSASKQDQVPSQSNEIFSNHKRKLEELQVANLELDFKNKNLDYQERCIRMYQALCQDNTLDPRAGMVFKESCLNLSMLHARSLSSAGFDAGAVMNTPISISMVASDMKIKLNPGDEMRVGTVMKDLYVAKHGKDPVKHPQLCGGKSIMVNSYYENDRPLLEEALQDLVAKREKAQQAPSKIRKVDSYFSRG